MDQEALARLEAALEAGPCESPCLRCGEKQWYSRRYDAFFCPRCDAWAEEACEDSHCEYCAGRPERPSLALDIE